MIPMGMQQGLGTLDQEVNDRADNMRLKGQTSTVSKDLLDVMASQRVAREKEMALKDLQASQETNPATVKEQLENQVMGMTQNEMTAQTAGILANRRPQSTPMMGKNPSLAINRGAPQGGIAGARPPMGAPPRPPMPQSAGIAGAPRPMSGPPPMMASGGIVGFQQGGLNDQQRRAKEYQASKGGYRVEAFTEALKRKGLTRQQFEALSPAEKQAIRATLPQIMQELKQTRDNYMSPLARINDATSPQALAEKRANADKQILKRNNPALFAQQYPDEVKPNTADVDTSATDTTDTSQGGDSTIRNALQAALAAKKQGGGGGDDAFTSRTTTTTGPASAGFDVTKAVTDLKTDPSITTEQQEQLDKSKNLVSDAMPQEMKDAITEGAKVDIGAKETDLQTKFDERYLPTTLGDDGKPQDGSLAGLKALQANQQKVLDYQADPEYQRKLRVQQSLGRGTSFAGAGKAELTAANNAITNYKDVMKTRLDALKTSDESVNNALTRIQTSRDKMLTLQLNMTAEDRKAYMAEKDQFLTQNEAFITAELKKLGIISQDQLKRSVETAQDKAELYNTLIGIGEAREKLKEERLKLVAAKIMTLEGSKDPDDKAELRRIRDEIDDNVAVAFLPEEDIILAAIESQPGGRAMADAFRAAQEAKRNARDGGAGGDQIQNSTGASQSSLSYVP
jgi:hypothetical protein